MNGSIKVKTILLISLLVLILGMIITGLLFLMISSNNQKSKISELDKSISNLEDTINNLQNNKEELLIDDIEDENTTQNVNTIWTAYPKNMYKKICDYFGIEFDKDSVSYKLKEKTLYGLLTKYTNTNENEFYDLYCDFGDSTKIIDTDSNYAKYCYPDNENNDLSTKYTKIIKYSISEFNELYYDGYYNLEQCTKNQYNSLLKENESALKNYYYRIGSVLVMNGNNESEEDFLNNSRAKKIKITINDEKEYEIDLKDTNEIQIFDIGYKQDTIEHPVNIEIEVLEQYDGENSDDVYISDIQFSIDSNIPQSR